jgi:hypothetical protein
MRCCLCLTLSLARRIRRRGNDVCRPRRKLTIQTLMMLAGQRNVSSLAMESWQTRGCCRIRQRLKVAESRRIERLNEGVNNARWHAPFESCAKQEELDEQRGRRLCTRLERRLQLRSGNTKPAGFPSRFEGSGGNKSCTM